MARSTKIFRADEVLKNGREFLAKRRGEIEAALMEVGLRIGADAVFEAPKPPIDWGVLRGSVNVSTRTQTESVAETSGPVRKQRGKSDRPGKKLRGSFRQGLKQLAVRVEFRTRYAARLHETDEGRAKSWPSKDFDPDVGPKFLSSKLLQNGDRYNKLMAQALRRRGFE